MQTVSEIQLDHRQREIILTPGPAPRLFDLIELILKDRPRLERIIRDPSLAGELIPRFLAISLVGFTFFGISLAFMISAVGVRIDLMSIKSTLDGARPVLMSFNHDLSFQVLGLRQALTAGGHLIAAYDLGLIAAAGVCLPSLYFYGLLAGVPMSMASVTVHTLKGMATTATALIGILPIYMAFSLGAAVFEAPAMLVDCVLATRPAFAIRGRALRSPFALCRLLRSGSSLPSRTTLPASVPAAPPHRLVVDMLHRRDACHDLHALGAFLTRQLTAWMIHAAKGCVEHAQARCLCARRNVVR